MSDTRFHGGPHPGSSCSCGSWLYFQSIAHINMYIGKHHTMHLDDYRAVLQLKPCLSCQLQVLHVLQCSIDTYVSYWLAHR